MGIDFFERKGGQVPAAHEPLQRDANVPNNDQDTHGVHDQAVEEMVKMMRSDNGPAFSSKPFKDFCEEFNI